MGFLITGAVLIASPYLFIPSRLNASKIVPAGCNVDGAARVLMDTAGWVKWWPVNGVRRSDVRLVRPLRRAAGIAIGDQGRPVPSLLSIFPMAGADSCYLQWKFTLDAGTNPLKRIARYREAIRLKEEMGVILDAFRVYVENRTNVYGIDIRDVPTKDSLVEETSGIVDLYPGTDVIYEVVDKLKRFIADHGGVPIGDPMVNVSPVAGGHYELRVALPTNKAIPDGRGFVSRNMPPMGRFLEAEVCGGPGAIRAGMHKMENYISDYRRTKMAIPFLSLVTDRRSEPDTAKWVTRIYFPIY
jgi:hypothetical protein